MSFLKKIEKLFSPDPIFLRMSLEHGGIRTGIYQRSQLLAHSYLTSGRFTRKLPPPLLDFLKSPKVLDYLRKDEYLLPWPIAQKLYGDLAQVSKETLQVQCEIIHELKTVERPSDFRVHWAYNRLLKRLERQLINAERYLGMGWFQKGDCVWVLDANVPSNVWKWIGEPHLPSRLISQFVSKFIPASQKADWPFTCELTVQTDLSLQLEVVKKLKRSMDVRLHVRPAGSLAALQPIDDDSENMISGHKLLPGLCSLMAGQLISLAKTGEVKRLSGDELYAFIQDDLRPRAARLGVDMRQIDASYPIIDGSQLKPKWKLEHETHQGIGLYRAKPYLATSSDEIPIAKLRERSAKGDRFYQSTEGCIEFTHAFKAHLSYWDSESARGFALDPQEVLGTYSKRLSSTKLSPPEIEVGVEKNEFEQAQSFIEMLRHHGLSGGFSGLQEDTYRLLVNACNRLLNDYPRAKILWVVSSRKKNAAVTALRNAGVAYVDSSINALSEIDGRVVVNSPESRVFLPTQWTLVIFHDLDLLASSRAHVQYFSQLRRTWSLATFTRAGWQQNSTQTRQVLEVLQLARLAPAGLERFQDRCIRVFSEQQGEGILSRLTSPFKKVLSGTTSSDRGAVPIPPRAAPMSSPTPVPPTTPANIQYGRTSTGVYFHFSSSREEDFVAQARRFAKRTETNPVPHAPFMQYWPTYSAMTPAQEKWYFYWRTQLRRGNCLPSDLSYLFIHIYEALNLIGFDSPQAAFDHLVAFWKHYRTQHARLDRYLIDWLADFVVGYQLPLTPLQWYGQALQVGAISGDIDLSVEAWLQTGGKFDALPDALLYKVAGYSPTKSKFYQEHGQSNQLDKAYRQGLQAVNQYLHQQSGKPLFATLCPPKVHTVTRMPFASALHNLPERSVTIARVHPWSSDQQLSSALTSILKYTENIFRARAGFKSKLRGIELPPQWASALETAFAVETPRPVITIDPAALAQLSKESEEVRERLLKDAETAVEHGEISIEQQPALEEMVKVPSGITPVQRPADTPEGALTSLDEIAAVLRNSGLVGMEILRLLSTYGWEADAQTLEAVVDGSFVNVEVDRINERAMECLGDNLIITENARLIVAEDYRDEIEYLLSHQAFDENQSAITGQAPGEPDAALSELDEQWASFVQKMQPHHWEAIAVLLAAVEVESRLDATARSVYTTSNRVIDDINEFALDSIGDIVIDTTAGVPAIEEEDIEGLRLLLEWAHNSLFLKE